MRFAHKTALRLCRLALENGGRQLGPTEWEWAVAGDCLSPVAVEVYGRPEGFETEGQAALRTFLEPEPAKLLPEGFNRETGGANIHRQQTKFHTWKPGRASSVRCLVWTRCRRCDACRRARSASWRIRARHECGCWLRTWFGTLTIRPDEQFQAVLRARARLKAQGIDYDAEPFVVQFIENCREVSGELTRFLKRVRKNSGAPLRYLLVSEAHKSGVPHFHVLIHEVDPVQPVRWDVMSGAWKLGFSSFKLTTDKLPADYVCKYISKSGAARVRASIRYGDVTAYCHRS